MKVKEQRGLLPWSKVPNTFDSAEERKHFSNLHLGLDTVTHSYHTGSIQQVAQYMSNNLTKTLAHLS